MPILRSIPSHATPLRGPRPPSDPGRNLGQTNMLKPRVPWGASGSLAKTKWTMLPASSCSPQVMKVFWP